MDAPDAARAVYLDYLARCEQAFRPFAPIDLPEFFAGRIDYIRRLDAEIGAPGRHVALFGERGVGKTSLARLAYFFVRRDENDTHFVRCERTSTFDSIFTDVLANAGIEVILNGVETEREHQGSIGIGSALGLGGARRLHRTYKRITAGPQITARLLLESLGGRDGLVVIDEYDRVGDPGTHTRLAELIKHFSDAAARTKIIVVGVAESVSQLIREHASLSRSLARLRLDRMKDEELGDIIDKGADYVQARFKGDVRHKIIRLADGFPYFVHLIGRHAARMAGRQLQHDRAAPVVVADEEYAAGLQGALANAEPTLIEQYEQATITTRRPSEKFALVLWGMALTDVRDVQVQDIAKHMSFFLGEEVKAASFSWNLAELVSEKRGHILTKLREGFYKFTNPLMRPYIRSVMELENVLYRGRQWQFPFMLMKS
jgi:Cdc6-like AAA superfamily ATPase